MKYKLFNGSMFSRAKYVLMLQLITTYIESVPNPFVDRRTYN